MSPHLLRLVNKYEEATHSEILKAAVNWAISVYPKIRLADVISLDSVGATGELKSFGLKAHFDFVVYDDNLFPLYAVEFDGQFHRTKIQIARDDKKNELCDSGGLPLLRVNSRYLTTEFGHMSLLAWIIEVDQMRRAFEDHQSRGLIPDSEPFDPFLMMSMDRNERRFPYWLSANSRVLVQKLQRDGKILDPASTGFVGEDERGTLYGLEFIRVTETESILVKTAMQLQRFPLMMSELLDEILFIQLYREVQRWAEGANNALPTSIAVMKLQQLKQKISMLHSHSYTHGPK